MSLATKHSWTPEKLREMPIEKVMVLRSNAARLQATELVQICDSELAFRRPLKKPASNQKATKKSGSDVVVEFHFVCSRGLGVTEAGDGKFWTGSWVVADETVAVSLPFEPLLALHESKAEPSYRQDKVLEFRRCARDMVNKDNDGLEFLVQETGSSLDWAGSGSGEKGYKWASLKKRASDGE